MGTRRPFALRRFMKDDMNAAGQGVSGRIQKLFVPKLCKSKLGPDMESAPSLHCDPARVGTMTCGTIDSGFLVTTAHLRAPSAQAPLA